MASPRKVSWNENDARRVAAATLAYERGNRDMPPIRFRTATGGDDEESFRVGLISQTWEKGKTANVLLLTPDGDPLTPSKSFVALNLFANVVVAGGTKRVGCALAGSSWLLVAAEC